jgi:hypothetical protein
MSDHLFRIAARATGRLTTLHPRPATRFESWRQPLPDGSPGELLNEVAGAPQGADGRSTVSRQTAVVRAERQTVASWLLERKSRDRHGARHIDASVELGSKASPTPLLARKLTPTSSRQLPGAVPIGQPDLPRPGPKGSRRGALPEVRSSLLNAQPASPARQSPVAASLSRTPPEGDEDRGTVTDSHVATGRQFPTSAVGRQSPDERETVGLSASAERPELLTSRQGLMPLAAPSLPRREAAAPERPMVKVTIGRIEVRAVPPAVQARTTPPRTRKTMSLDEYLQQRSRGDR